MHLAILALDGLFDTGLAVLRDALGLANKFSVMQMGGPPPFEVTVVGMRRRVRTAQGVRYTRDDLILRLHRKPTEAQLASFEGLHQAAILSEPTIFSPSITVPSTVIVRPTVAFSTVSVG